MKRALGITLLFWIALCGPSVAEDLYETRLDRGLTNTDPYASLLMEQAAGDRRNARELLLQAKRYAPDLPAVYFALAREGLSIAPTGLFEGIDYFRQGLLAYGRNFWWGFSLAGLFLVSLAGSLVFAFCILIAIRLPQDYRLLRHDFLEDKRKLGLFFVPLVLSFFGLPALVAGLLFIVGLYIAGRDKAVVYGAFLFLLVSPVLLPAAKGFLRPPSPELRAASAVNEGRDNSYALLVLGNGTDFVSAFSHSLALKREGRYAEAMERLRAFTNGNDPAVYVNLGNTVLAMNNPAAAAEAYRRAISIRPLPSALYNLSQVHRESFDFAKGDEYFLEAARLDNEAVSRFAAVASRNPNRFVADETLPAAALWRSALASGPWTAAPAVQGLALIVSFSFLDRRLRLRSRRCRRCGSVYCGRCSRTFAWGQMCPQCLRFFVRLEELDARERIARLVSVHQDQARRRRIIRTLSLLAPGTGQIYAGKVLAGFLFLWPFLFALVLLTMNYSPLPRIAPFGQTWVLAISATFLGTAYLLSVLHVRQGMRRGWL